MAATILGVGSASDQPAIFQQVNQGHSVAGIDADEPAQLLLGGSAQLFQTHQHAEVMRAQVPFNEHPAPAPARFGSHPGQQVPGAGLQPAQVCSVAWGCRGGCCDEPQASTFWL